MYLTDDSLFSDNHEKLIIASIVLLSMVLWCGLANAQQKLFVYPQKGQNAEQQDKDEYDCYKWAKANSGVNPMAPAQQQNRRAAGTVRGAAGGAALGALGGAIAGNAGKGAAIGALGGGVLGRRKGVMTERMEQEVTVNTYHRAFAACMEGRGYTVK